MSLEERQFKVEKPFGPYIVKSTISDETHKILLNTAYKIRKNEKLKKDNDYRKSLAGNLAEEYSYKNAFTKKEEKIVSEELCWMASVYTKMAKDYINVNRSVEPHNIIIHKPFWVNFMKNGEWNPFHNHTGLISCVCYLKIPKEIAQENNSGKSSSKSNSPSAGKIEFRYGDGYYFYSNMISYQPSEKDIIFFPATLQHAVYPFKSKTERISFSCNFADKVLSHKDLQKTFLDKGK